MDESKLAALAGNTRPEANLNYDRGPVPDNLLLQHMLLQLKRSPERERELQQFLDELQDSSSPNFHQWLTAREFGERFGLARPDLDTIKNWLQSHGLKVNVVYANGLLIDFSGTASQVREALHSEIRQLIVNGVKHIANMRDPQIPVALLPAVAGVVSLHDFMPHAMYKPRANYIFDSVSGTDYAVVPADLATIYNLNPLFNAGISGQGQRIAVIENTNVYRVADWRNFRSVFGLSSFTSGSFTQIHPAPSSGPNNCEDPGATLNDVEAIIDAEYASAAAPSAAIELVSCSDTMTTFGGLIALQNLLNGRAPPPALVSISYGECEAENGATANAAYNAAYQQAAGQGVAVFVSSGDEGAAGCDANLPDAINGIGVNGFASTPYDVAVGGTDYGDTYAGTNNTYWNAHSTATYGSARSYIPEIPWNDSCASQLIATKQGYSTTYGSGGFCNSSAGKGHYLTTVSGSGGPSGCATGSSESGVVDGACAGWTKPSWQSLIGNPADGVRDLPDVSLFAANAVWGHYYIFCFSGGGVSCYSPPDEWPGAGGTSFSSPIMAGIQALVNQKMGASQGLPNKVYYELAATEYGASGDGACDSTLGNRVGNSCIFYDVTQGDMDVNCILTYNCYQPSGEYGVLSTSNSSYQPAYAAATGWDFATGIGTVNAANLVNNWPGSTAGFTLSGMPGALTIVRGADTGSDTITVTPVGLFASSVTLTAPGLPPSMTASFSRNPATLTSILTLTAATGAPLGTRTVTITGTSGRLNATTTITLTVNPVGSFELQARPSIVSIAQGSKGTSAITIKPTKYFTQNVTLSASGLPKGVTASFTPNPATTASTLTFDVDDSAAIGRWSITVTGAFESLSHATTVVLEVASR